MNHLMFVQSSEVTVNALSLRESFIFISVCHLCVDLRRGQKRVLDPLKLELLAAVSHQMWTLGTKLRASREIVGTLNF